MKTIIKTTVKGNENITVKQSVKDVYEILVDKKSFALLTRLNGISGETDLILRKSSIKMVKEQ